MLSEWDEKSRMLQNIYLINLIITLRDNQLFISYKGLK